MKTSLFKHQEDAVKRFSRQKIGALFMEMGTGKTAVSIQLANLNSNRYDVILWLAPLNTITTAKKEIGRIGTIKDVIFVGYESISQSDAIYSRLISELNGKRAFLVCDESLFLKNGSTKRYRRTRHIRNEFAEFCLLLNGTPISKDEMDLFWQMELLSRKIIGIDADDFRKAMFTKVTVEKKRRSKVYYKRSQKNINWLKARIEPYVIESELNLDVELSSSYKYVPVNQDTQKLYDAEKSKLIKAIEEWEEAAVLSSLTRMKIMAAVDLVKCEVVAELSKENRCLVFTEYREEQKKISKAIGGSCFIINGDTISRERARIIEEWRVSRKPLIIMFGIGSLGLNLQEASKVIISSLTWDYATYDQAIHRVLRIGREEDVEVINVLPSLGITDIVKECLDKKITITKLIKEIDWRNHEITSIQH